MSQTYMRRETDEAATVLRRLLSQDSELIDRVARLLANAPGPLTTAARGSSDHAVTVFKYASEILLGRPVASIGPSVASVYEAELRVREGIHFTVSQSGASPDILALQDAASRGGATTVAIVNVVDSPLARGADFVVPLGAGIEASVAATKTYIASCAVLLLLVARAARSAELLDGLKRLPEALEALPVDADTRLAETIAEGRSLYVSGRGPAFGIALEAALKAKETSGVHAEAFSMAELMHGPLQLVREEFPVVVFVPDDASCKGTLAAIERLSELGGAVTPISTIDLAGGLVTPSTGHPFSDTLVFMLAWYRAVERAARVRGLDPDHPANLSKVTETL